MGGNPERETDPLLSGQPAAAVTSRKNEEGRGETNIKKKNSRVRPNLPSAAAD